MKAAVLRGGRIRLEEIQEPIPEPGEMLVRVLACGVCGSDLHRIDESSECAGAAEEGSEGLVLGHEFCAEVVDGVSSGGRRFEVGRPIVSFPALVRATGTEIIGFSSAVPGGFGQSIVVSEEMALAVPNGLDPKIAALTEPMAVGEHAVKVSGIRQGGPATVIGCGPVGLAVISALKRRGCEPVIASDFSARRRKIALRMGADIVVDPAEYSPYTRWAEYESSGGFAMPTYAAGDSLAGLHIFECVGARGIINDLMLNAPSGSTIIVVGACGAKDDFEPFQGLIKELRLQFSNAYTRSEFADTLRAISEGILRPDPMLTAALPLSQIEQGIQSLKHGTEVKIVVNPQ